MRSPWHHSVQVPVYIINIRTCEASNPLTSLSGPATVALSPFTVDTATALRAFHVRIARPLPGRLLLDYELEGELQRVRLGADAATGGAGGEPTDGLWRHT